VSRFDPRLSTDCIGGPLKIESNSDDFGASASFITAVSTKDPCAGRC
jgi:hypothetical protein